MLTLNNYYAFLKNKNDTVCFFELLIALRNIIVVDVTAFYELKFVFIL
jgi:hypothetical protein